MSWFSEQLKKSKRKGTGIYSWAGSGQAAAIGVTIGSAIPVVGTVIGGAMGGALDLLVGLTADTGKKKPSGTDPSTDWINDILSSMGTTQAVTQGQRGFEQLIITSTR